MPKYMDRSTRQLVWQYGNERGAIDWHDETDIPRKECAPKVFGALERLLDACAEAERNAPRSRSPMVTVHYIRKQITEALESDA